LRQRLGNEQSLVFLFSLNWADSFPAFAEAEFLDKIQTKVFLLVIHSHIYSFAGDFYFLKPTQPLTIYVKEKGGKSDRKPYPLPYGLRNPYKNLMSENSQDYA
jgi:hypothetical protein